MVIETVQFSFPIDFLQSLTCQTNSNVRYFTASGTGKGGLSSCDDRTNYQITFDCQNDFANFHVAGNFSHKEKSVRFNFDEWSENGDLSANVVKDEILKSQKSDVAYKSIIKTRSQKREYVRAITEEGPFSPRSKLKKTTSQAKSNNSLTEKQTSQSRISTYLRSNNEVSKDQNSLDLTSSGKNWSSPGEEREEPNEDLFHPRDQAASHNENKSKPHCFAKKFPNFHRMKKILPKPDNLKPIVKPFLLNEPFQSSSMKMFSSNKEGEIENSTFNKPSMFPLLESTGIMKLVAEEKQAYGKPPQYCLVFSAEDDKKAVPVYFYTNISKGVEADPGNLPEEFKIIPVSDAVDIPIVINIRKYESHRKHFQSSLSKKLEDIQTMGGLTTTMKSGDSHNISNKEDTVSKKLRSLQNRIALASKPKKMDSGGKTGSLSMGKLTLEEAEQSESSSSDSEMDYEDEMDLIRIPKLSVLYPSTLIHKKSYDSLKVGKEIALLNFVISSTDLLRSPKNTYYIQGVKDGVEGIVLLGPFVMSHNPQAHLSFMRQPQCLRRIPEAIYKRRRDRWLRKHDKKQFERSLTGVEGDSLVAFVDHDYLTQRADTAPGESNSCQRETTQNEQLETEDVVITSTWGIQNETNASENEAEEEQTVLSSAMEESQIPLISSLDEAMTTRLKKACLGKSDRDTEMSAETPASVPEAVTFDTLPPVTVEATLNSAGVQLNCRVLRKQKTQKVQSEQAPVKLNQAPAESKEASVKSVRAPIQSHLDFIKQSIVLVDNDDSLHTPYKYTCKYCLKLTVTNFTLYDHIRFTHQDVPGYLEYAREVQRKEGIRCEYCQKETIFYSQDGLRTHTNFHHPDKVKGRSNKVDKRTCPTCKKVFSQVKALRKHIERIHVGVQYLCDKCPGIFKSEEALENHMKGKHDNIRNYTCHICGASYVTPTYLRKHVKLVHKKERNKKKDASNQGMSRASKVKKCFLCGHRFDQANLKKHMRQIHGVDFEKLKRCSDCSLTFNTRAELEFHRHTAHEVEYSLSCPYCGASYVLKSNFNEHILTFHFSLNVHQCYICKQAHNKGYKLTEHMLQEHPGLKAQDEDHQLSCSHCLEKFSTHKSLVDHVLSPVHHSVFPHNCLTCPQRFMHEHDLEHHIKVVHGMNEDVDFEIRCNSVEDRMVQMVVKCEVKSIDDLPAKAQLALKRLYSQGKTVMIVSKQAQNKKSTTEKKNVSNRDPKFSMMNRAELNGNHSKSQEQDVDCEKDYVNSGVKLTPPLCQSSVFQTSNPQMAVSKSIYPEASSLSIPQGIHHAKPLQQSNEVLRVYRLAVQSEEVARAFQTLNPHHGRQLQSEVVEEQVLSVDDEFVVAEQIGRLDESGNIIEDRVVYVDYEPVPQEMLLNMLPETYMQ